MEDDALTPADEERYLALIEILSVRSDQIQARSSHRHSVGATHLQEIVLFLAGGLASGVLNRFGERLSDFTVESLRRLLRLVNRDATHRQGAVEAAEGGEPKGVDGQSQGGEITSEEAADALRVVAQAVEESNMSDEAVREAVCVVLVDLRYSEWAAVELASRIADRLIR